MLDRDISTRVCPSHVPPGTTVIAIVSIEIPKQNEGIPKQNKGIPKQNEGIPKQNEGALEALSSTLAKVYKKAGTSELSFIHCLMHISA